MIKKYLEFIKEAYKEEESDSSDIAKSKDHLNNMAKWINEYSSKKTILHNIYMTYVDDKDLISKLKAQKLVADFEVDKKNPQKLKSTNLKDSKRMIFLNPILDEFSKIFYKKRRIKILEEDISKQDENINDRKSSIERDAQLAPSFTKDIERMSEKIVNINAEIAELKSEIKLLETQAQNKLQLMRRELTQKNKQLSDDILDKPQPQIVAEK